MSHKTMEHKKVAKCIVPLSLSHQGMLFPRGTSSRNWVVVQGYLWIYVHDMRFRFSGNNYFDEFKASEQKLKFNTKTGYL